MTDYEVYDKFFADEEYELENAPTETYSYRSGWNNGLKRAAILISDEVRPQGEWIDHSSENLLWGHNECPFCHKRSNRDASYCQYCGADMRGEKK